MKLRERSDGVEMSRTIVVAVRGRLFAEALARLVNTLDGFVAQVYDAENLDVGEDDPPPDLIIVETDRRRGGTLDSVQRARLRWPHVPAVVFTRSTSRAMQAGAAEGDAVGWLNADMGPAELHDVLSCALGGTALPRCSPERRSFGPSRPLVSELNRLTARELQVVRLLAAGEPITAIAEVLSISSNTVRKHTQNAMYKVGATSRLKLVTTAHDMGLAGWSNRPAVAMTGTQR